MRDFYYNFKDLSGMIFNSLTVLHQMERAKCNGVKWVCKCICGNIVVATTQDIKSGHTKSCGCYRIEVTKKSRTKHGQAKKTSEYLAWTHMKTRCTNPEYYLYHRYGGRGIKVCNRWLGEHGYEHFFEDMGGKPSNEYSLDRYPNKNGDYEKSNCRWATMEQQQQNRVNNKWFEYNGVKMVQTQWARELKVSPSCLAARLKKGQPFNEIVEFYMNKNICKKSR